MYGEDEDACNRQLEKKQEEETGEVSKQQQTKFSETMFIGFSFSV